MLPLYQVFIHSRKLDASQAVELSSNWESNLKDLTGTGVPSEDESVGRPDGAAASSDLSRSIVPSLFADDATDPLISRTVRGETTLWGLLRSGQEHMPPGKMQDYSATADLAREEDSEELELIEDTLWTAEVTRLFFVAVPPSFTLQRILTFAGIKDARILRGALRLVNQATGQLSVCLSFRSVAETRQCLHTCHGQRWAPPRTEICHVLLASGVAVLSDSTVRRSRMREAVSREIHSKFGLSAAQLPLCPNCLERLDPNISHIWSHLCQSTSLSSQQPSSKKTTPRVKGAPSSASSALVGPSSTTVMMSDVSLTRSLSAGYDGSPRVDSAIEQSDDRLAWDEDCRLEISDALDFVPFGHSQTGFSICRCTHRWPSINCRVCKAVHSEHNVFVRRIKQEEHPKHPAGSSSHMSAHRSRDYFSRSGEVTLASVQSFDLDRCCEESRDLWLCLVCGNVGCGRRAHRHSLDHFNETQHRFTLNLEDLCVWDYIADIFVHRTQRRRMDNKLEKNLSLIRAQEKLEQQICVLGSAETPGGPSSVASIHPSSESLRREGLLEGARPEMIGSVASSADDGDASEMQSDFSRLQLEEHEMAVSKLESMQSYLNEVMTEVLLEQLHYLDEQLDLERQRYESMLSDKKEELKQLQSRDEHLQQRQLAFEQSREFEKLRASNVERKAKIDELMLKSKEQQAIKDKMKERYERRETDLVQEKERQIELLQSRIDETLSQF